MTHARIMRRDPFRSSAGWTYAPDVQLVGEGTLDEVDERRVGSPQWKVTVEPGRRRENGPIIRSPAAVCHEQRVSGSGRVVGESGRVMRPVELGHAFKVWLWLPAQRWHRPDADVIAA